MIKLKKLILPMFLIIILFSGISLIGLSLSKNKVKIEQLFILNNKLQNKINEFEIAKIKSKDDIKNYILTHYKTIPLTIIEEIAQNILMASKKHDISFITIVAVMEVESSFNPMQVGPRTKYGKARGLMQVMPKFWTKELNLKNKYDFHDIRIGIDSGTYVLKKYLMQENYNMKRALYKYVNGDNQYVRDVYGCMGKFVVHRNIANMKKQKIINDQNGKDIIKNEVKDFMHIIKYRGETLSLIAKWRTGKTSNWRKILKANPHIVPKKMYIGTKIIIPKELIKITIPITKKFIDEYYESQGRAKFFSNKAERIL